MKSIIEYKGKRKEVNLPHCIEVKSKWLQEFAKTDDEKWSENEGEFFNLIYYDIQDHYTKIAFVVFGVELVMEAFKLKKKGMKNVLDYCVFVDPII